MIVLPPKRFEPVSDTRFDPIRWKPWFARLEERREKIPLLRQAHYDLVAYSQSQKECAERYSIDDRELRDYVAFVTNSCQKPTPTEQKILDSSYEIYCLNKADITIKSCMERVAGYYGRNPRHIGELWDVHPTFYPTGYVYQIAVSACLTNEIHPSNETGWPQQQRHPKTPS